MTALRGLAIAASIVCASAAAADQFGDAAAGARLVEQVCSRCHGVGSIAPDFAAVAAMPSTTANALNVFFLTSHPTMPNFDLSESRRNDAIAYILSLKK